MNLFTVRPVITFPSLFLEKLPKHHPEYSKPEYKPDRMKIKKLVKEAFPRAEELKKKLTSQFESEKAVLEEKLAEEVGVYVCIRVEDVSVFCSHLSLLPILLLPSSLLPYLPSLSLLP